MLDIIGATEELGKTQGSDERHNKTTFPGLIGLEASESRAKQLCLEAQKALSEFGDSANILQQLASYIIARTQDRKSTRLNSSHVSISYAVFCLKKKIR